MHQTEYFSNLKDFYRKLQDDESRFIFNSRFLYFLNEDDEHLWKMVDKIYKRKYFSKEITRLKELKQSGVFIIFYGAGAVGSNAMDYFKRHGLIPDFFCDKNTDKQKNGYMNIPVVSLQTLAEKYRNAAIVITSSSVHANEIKCELKELDVNSNIYDFFINRNIYDYFDYNFLKPVENEIYLDCGVLDGSTIETFVNFTNGQYSRIYGYEPDKTSFERTLNYLQSKCFKRVNMINMGVWNETALLSFTEKGDGGSHISDDGVFKIPVTTIDESIDGEGGGIVTFIKMDIEGAELNALRGAAKTIRRCKPRLAICIYHKPEDILEIPMYINSLVPEYRFYLRHHAISKSETVLYAINEDSK